MVYRTAPFSMILDNP